MLEGKILSLGCGSLRHPGDVTYLDIRRTPLVDVVHDLEAFPWPFDVDEFDHILAVDIVEHLADVMKTVDECWRIVKLGGTLQLRVPAWDKEQSYTDPTHRHWFNLKSFDFFDPTTFFGMKYGHYTDKKWIVERREAPGFGNELEFVLRKVRHAPLSVPITHSIITASR